MPSSWSDSTSKARVAASRLLLQGREDVGGGHPELGQHLAHRGVVEHRPQQVLRPDLPSVAHGSIMTSAWRARPDASPARGNPWRWPAAWWASPARRASAGASRRRGSCRRPSPPGRPGAAGAARSQELVERQLADQDRRVRPDLVVAASGGTSGGDEAAVDTRGAGVLRWRGAARSRSSIAVTFADGGGDGQADHAVPAAQVEELARPGGSSSRNSTAVRDGRVATARRPQEPLTQASARPPDLAGEGRAVERRRRGRPECRGRPSTAHVHLRGLAARGYCFRPRGRGPVRRRGRRPPRA